MTSQWENINKLLNENGPKDERTLYTLVNLSTFEVLIVFVCYFKIWKLLYVAKTMIYVEESNIVVEKTTPRLKKKATKLDLGFQEDRNSLRKNLLKGGKSNVSSTLKQQGTCSNLQCTNWVMWRVNSKVHMHRGSKAAPTIHPP